MTNPTFAHRLQTLQSPASRLCIGVDPHPAILVSWGLADTAAGAKEFGDIVIGEALAAGVTLVKPQVAFFERHGVAGLDALSQLIGQARQRGLVVIADAKRGDVGSTVNAYAQAWLGSGGDFESDAMTAVAYQGLGSVEPMCEAAIASGKGLFVLVNTSNPDGWELQRASVNNVTTVAQHLYDGLVSRQLSSGVGGWLGAVIGATVAPADRAVTVTDDPPVWILAPGFGFQGAILADLPRLFGDASHRVIPTVSRSVVQDGPEFVGALIAHHHRELNP